MVTPEVIHATSHSSTPHWAPGNLPWSLSWLSRALRAATSGDPETEIIVEQAARALERSAHLQKVAFALTTASTPADVMDVVLDQGIAAIGAVAGLIALIDADERSIALVALRGYPPEAATRWSRLPLDAPVPIAETARTGRALYFCTGLELADQYPAAGFSTRGDHAVALVPLRAGNRILGTLGFSLPRAHEFQGVEIEFIEVFAQHCAFALDRARLLEAERNARRLAEKASEEQSEFLSLMSHELRTPLNAINGYTELMTMGLHGPLPEPYANYVSRIRDAQQHLLGLINRGLSFSRLEVAAVQYDIESISVRDSVHAIDPLIRKEIDRKQLDFTCAIPPELTVSADSDRVRQILLNLITNAIKFTPQGGCITLSGTRSGNRCRVEVSDNGIGIPPDKLEIIFDPFARVERNHSPEGGCTGLGLAISRDLARGMGGDLNASSTVGEGSVLVLELPA